MSTRMNIFSTITSFMIVCYSTVQATHGPYSIRDSLLLLPRGRKTKPAATGQNFTFDFEHDWKRNTIKITNDVALTSIPYCYWFNWNGTGRVWTRHGEPLGVPSKGRIIQIPNVANLLTIRCKSSPREYDYDSITRVVFRSHTLAELKSFVTFNARNVTQKSSKQIRLENTNQTQPIKVSGQLSQSPQWSDPKKIHHGVEWLKHAPIFGIIFVCIGLMFGALFIVVKNYLLTVHKNKCEIDTVINKQDTLPSITDRYCIETEAESHPNKIFKFDDFPKEKIKNLERTL